MDIFRPDLFRELSDKEASKQVFKDVVQEVQIEVFSYCNRHCAYCPVADSSRRGANHLLDIDLFERTLKDLAEIGYDRRIGLNLYNEPLADLVILDRISAIRAALPETQIYFYSNGDYLDAELIKTLKKAGLDELFISIHLSSNQAYDDSKVRSALEKLADRTGLEFIDDQFVPGQYLRAKAPLAPFSLEAFALNYLENGQDRGGLMDNILNANERLSPCDRPFHNFVVSYDGTVVPCCQIFVDREEHSAHGIGHLSSFPDIFRAYTSAAMASWRLDNLGHGPKDHEPCSHCSDGDFELSDEEIELRNKAKQLIVADLRNIS